MADRPHGGPKWALSHDSEAALGYVEPDEGEARMRGRPWWSQAGIIAVLAGCGGGAQDKSTADPDMDTDTDTDADTDTDTDADADADADTDADTDTDTGTPPGVGCVVFTDLAGNTTDHSATVAAGVAGSPALLTLTDPGTLALCPGTWHVRLVLQASIDVFGEPGVVLAHSAGSVLSSDAGTTVSLADVEVVGADNADTLIRVSSDVFTADRITLRGVSSGMGMGAGFAFDTGGGQQITVRDATIEDVWVGLTSITAGAGAPAALTAERLEVRRTASAGLHVDGVTLALSDSVFGDLATALSAPRSTARVERAAFDNVQRLAELRPAGALTLVEATANALSAATVIEQGASLVIEACELNALPAATSAAIELASTGAGFSATRSTLRRFRDSALRLDIGAGVTVALTDLVFLQNVGASAIDARGAGTLEVVASRFEGHRGVAGGAIHADLPDVEISRSTFTNNAAAQSGGAVYLGANVLRAGVTGSTFTANAAGDAGSALYLRGDGALTLEGSTFQSNSSTTALATEGPATLDSVDFFDNSAAAGCSTWTLSAPSSIRGGSLARNQGTQHAAICVEAALQIDGTVFGYSYDANTPDDVWDGSTAFSVEGAFSGTCAPSQSCSP